MSRIGSLGSLSSNQLMILNRLSAIGSKINQNTERLATLKRINSAKDDPAGLVSSLLLESQLAGIQGASDGLTQVKAILATADDGITTTISQLQDARTLILETAGGGLSAAEIAANQLELDSILDGIESTSRSTYGSRRLLDGSSGFTPVGVDTTKIQHLDVLSKTSADNYTVDINVSSAATKAADSYTGGTLGSATTLTVTGSEGTTVIQLANGATKTDIAEAFNAVTYLTGVAAAVSGANVNFSSTGYGTDATIRISATSGTFATTSGGSAAGTNAVATINGQTVTGEGARFTFSNPAATFVVDVNPATTGAISTFTINGSGINVSLGLDPGNTARIGLPSLVSSHRGGADGTLSSLASGGANNLITGDAATALRIVDDAISQTLNASARLGGFEKYLVDSSASLLDTMETNTQAALEDIQGTDVALETTLLTNNQLIQQAAIQALSVVNLQGSSVLSLLQTAFGY